MSYSDREESVLNVYESIYRLLHDSYRICIKKGDFRPGEIESLSFILHAWDFVIGASGKSKVHYQDIIKSYSNSRDNQINYLAKGLTPKQASLRDIYTELSCSYLSFALQDCANIDVIIELGGGCGHNLIKAKNLFGSSFNNKTLFINAEISRNGRTLSERLFEDFKMSNTARSIKFDHNDALEDVNTLMPFIRDKDVVIYTASSLEQVTCLEYNFFQAIERIAMEAKSFRISFCEPIAWQLARYLPKDVSDNSRAMAEHSSLNTNLYSLAMDWVQNSKCGASISSISPSIFWHGYHISGINLTASHEINSYMWSKRH